MEFEEWLKFLYSKKVSNANIERNKYFQRRLLPTETRKMRKKARKKQLSALFFFENQVILKKGKFLGRFGFKIKELC